MVNKKLYAALLLSVFCVSGAFAAKDAEMMNDNAMTTKDTGKSTKSMRRQDRRSEARREVAATETIPVGREMTKNCGYTSCNKRTHGHCGHCSDVVEQKPTVPKCSKWVEITKPACEHIQTLKQYNYTCPVEEGYKMVDRKA